MELNSGNISSCLLWQYVVLFQCFHVKGSFKIQDVLVLWTSIIHTEQSIQML